MMARHLHEAGVAESERQAKKALCAALVRVAAALGNRPAVCRKSYIHPFVIGAYLERTFRLEAAEAEASGLRSEEAAVLAMLRALEDAAREREMTIGSTTAVIARSEATKQSRSS